MNRIGPPQEPAASCRLLIVASRQLIGQALEALFHRGGCCDSLCVEIGTERALERVVELKPEVVLLDLRLPGSDTFELARLIHTRCPGSRILFLDDSLHIGRLQAALKLCCAGYLTLEDSFDALRGAVLQVAAGNSAFSEAAAPHLRHINGRVRYKASRDGQGLNVLTRRQFEILTLLSEGLTVKECAQRLQIAPSTVDNHKTRLMSRLGVHKVVDLVRVALQERLLDQEPDSPEGPPETD